MKNLQKDQKHIIWATTRSILELEDFKSKKSGKRSRSYWTSFEKVLRAATFFIQISGFKKRGINNALAIQKNEVSLSYKNLPPVFDGFKILHLSDLHIDALPELPQAIINAIGDETYDVCLVTGDYRFHVKGEYKQTINPLKTVFNTIKTRYGIFATLGNHDTFRMTRHEDELGIKFLINSSIIIEKEGHKICLTGTDDPFKYYTYQAIDAIEEQNNGFKIALVHTTELSEIASKNNYSLYLCGHTHGGQICLPGGIPIITHQFEGRKFYRNKWELNGMKGYTNIGCGVSGIPIRINSRGEVVKIILQTEK